MYAPSLLKNWIEAEVTGDHLQNIQCKGVRVTAIFNMLSIHTRHVGHSTARISSYMHTSELLLMRTARLRILSNQ